MVEIRIKDFMGHEDVTVPMYRRTKIEGLSGAGKSAVLEAFCAVAFGCPSWNLSANIDRAVVREGAPSAEVSLVVGAQSATRRIRPNRSDVQLNGGAATMADLRAWTCKTFWLPSVEVGLLVVSPSYWQTLASGPGDGRALRDLLATLAPAAGDPLEGKVFEGEPRTEKAAEAHRAAAKKAHTATAAALGEAKRALDVFAPCPAPVADSAVLAARRAIEEGAAARSAYQEAKRRHDVWTSNNRTHVQFQANRSAWLASRPEEIGDPVESSQHDAAKKAADAARAKADAAAGKAQDAERSRGRLAARADALDEQVRALNARIDHEAAGAEPGCARNPGCELSRAGKVRGLTEDRDKAASELSALRSEIGTADEAIAELRRAAQAASIRAAEASSDFEAFEARRVAADRHAAAMRAWKLREPKSDVDPGEEPIVPALPDGLEEHAALVSRAEAVQAQIKRWKRDREAAEHRVAKLTEDAIKTEAAARRAEELVEIVRAAPGEAFATVCSVLSVGPVEVVAAGDGVDVRLYGRPWRMASDGQKVVGGAWLRARVRELSGARVPLFIDQMGLVGGLEWPDLPVAVWLKTNKSGFRVSDLDAVPNKGVSDV